MQMQTLDALVLLLVANGEQLGVGPVLVAAHGRLERLSHGEVADLDAVAVAVGPAVRLVADAAVLTDFAIV